MLSLTVLALSLLPPLAFAALPQSPAPSVAGIWLGTLATGGPGLRLQMHLDTGAGAACTLDSVDQKAFGIPCALLVEGTHVSVKVPAVSGGWAGDLSADGQTLTGTWTQGADLPLTFTRQKTALPPPAAAVAPTMEPAQPPVPLEAMQTLLDKELAPAIDHGALAPSTHAGITIGVVQHGARRIFTYGAAKPDSVFEIGSISKTFTATILAQMVQQHKVRLDEPVRELLPPGAVAKPATGGEITLLDLSKQHSGLPRMPENFHPADPTNPYADYDARHLYEFMAKQGVALPANAPFVYSNLGVGLLGQALSVRAGMPYPELLHAQVTGPLGMHDTAIALTPSMRARFIQGYNDSHNPAHAWDLDALTGAGGIRSTAADMLTYLEAQLHPDKLPAGAAATEPGKTLPAAIAQTHEVHAEAGPGMHIALNWFRYDGTGNFWHNGGTGGYSSYALFSPEGDFAVIVLCNTSPGEHSITDKLGQHIAQRLAGRPAVSLAP